MLGQVFVKFEYFNLVGLIKDCVVKVMFEYILNIYQYVKLNVIEVILGNSGVVCVWLGVIYQVLVIIVMFEYMFKECQQLICFYGVNLVFMFEIDGMFGVMVVVEILLKMVEGVVLMDQFVNLVNVVEYVRSIVCEIWQDMGEDIDVVVIGMGIGGIVMGIGCFLKQQDVLIEIVIVEFSNCLLFSEGKVGLYGIFGVYLGLILFLLDKCFIDKVLMVIDDVVFDIVCWVVRKEGIVVGILSGVILLVVLLFVR